MTKLLFFDERKSGMKALRNIAKYAKFAVNNKFLIGKITCGSFLMYRGMKTYNSLSKVEQINAVHKYVLNDMQVDVYSETVHLSNIIDYVRHGDVASIKYLIENEYDVNEAIEDNKFLLICAIQFNLKL